MEVPYSFNQLSSAFNTLQYTFTDMSGTFTRTLIFPVGNYNITQWLTTFLDVLNKDIYSQRPGWLTTYLVASYSSATGRVTMVSIAPTTSITFKFSANYVIALMLGFPQVDQTLSNSSILISINKVLCNPVNAIFLRSDSLKFSSSYEAVVSPYSQADIVARIPVPTLPNSWIYYRSDVKQVLSNTEISTLNFYWSDNLDPHYILDLNGLPYGLQITIEEVQMRDTNSFKDKLVTGKIPIPAPLLQERDQTLKELTDMRGRLEQQIAEAKKRKVEQAEKMAVGQLNIS
jgi:hypothetical protein